MKYDLQYPWLLKHINFSKISNVIFSNLSKNLEHQHDILNVSKKFSKVFEKAISDSNFLLFKWSSSLWPQQHALKGQLGGGGVIFPIKNVEGWRISHIDERIVHFLQALWDINIFLFTKRSNKVSSSDYNVGNIRCNTTTNELDNNDHPNHVTAVCISTFFHTKQSAGNSRAHHILS